VVIVPHTLPPYQSEPTTHLMECAVLEVVAGEVGLSTQAHALGVRHAHHYCAVQHTELSHGVDEVLDSAVGWGEGGGRGGIEIR
jgi:hypothetical protein